MEGRIERAWFSNRSTIARSYLDGIYECFTLEPPARPKGVKVPGVTAIPEGRYEAVIRFSPKHQREVIGLLDVPGFSDVEWHVGNFPHDTEGCTLPGVNRGIDVVTYSALAFERVFRKVKAAIERGERVFFTYENCPAPDSPMLPPIEEVLP